jgi:hypothetical protein
MSKLTKALIFSVAPGSFVVSNVASPLGIPVFDERVGGWNDRAAAWQRALKSGAAQRKCHLAGTEAEHEALKTRLSGLAA